MGVPDRITNIGGPAIDLYAYGFTSVSGSAVACRGWYVGADGRQIGIPVTYSITTATTLTLLAGGTLPANAVGFVMNVPADLYYCRAGQVDGTITAGCNPAAGDPKIVANSCVAIGHVGPTY